MDIKQLRYFVSIVDYKGFSRASRQLFITQPTLSSAVKKMEMELNLQLFQETNKELLLTEAGKFLYTQAVEILNAFDHMMDGMQGFQNQQSLRLTIGLPTLFAMEYMAAFSEYMRLYPNVEINMVQGGSYDLQNKLAQGKLDIGVLSFPNTHKDITLEPLKGNFKGYHANIVMAKNHKLAGKERVSFIDLVEENFCRLSDRFVLGSLLKTRSHALGFTPKVVLIDDNWELLLSSLQNLNAVCIMAKEYQRYYPNNQLHWADLNDEEAFFPIGIAYRSKEILAPHVEALVALLRSIQ